MDEYAVFKLNPTEKGNAKDEVKEPLVRNGENDERWREGEEDHYKTMEVVAIWI